MNSKQEKLQRISEAITVTTLPSGVRLVSNTMSIEDIKQIIDECLAEPLRNCDVGTADEQETRFTEFCDAHKYVGDDGANTCSRSCPFYNKIDCGVFWSQLPYKSEVWDA